MEGQRSDGMVFLCILGSKSLLQRASHLCSKKDQNSWCLASTYCIPRLFATRSGHQLTESSQHSVR